MWHNRIKLSWETSSQIYFNRTIGSYNSTKKLVLCLIQSGENLRPRKTKWSFARLIVLKWDAKDSVFRYFWQNRPSPSLIIGPESDHWLCLSLTNWLTNSLTHSRKLDWCDPGMWRWQLKTYWQFFWPFKMGSWEQQLNRLGRESLASFHC